MMYSSPFHNRAGVPAKGPYPAFRYPNGFARLPWQLFVRRLETAKTKRAMDRLAAYHRLKSGQPHI
jgi:hypothetical protein